jgi:hypothetical protein
LGSNQASSPIADRFWSRADIEIDAIAAANAALVHRQQARAGAYFCCRRRVTFRVFFAYFEGGNAHLWRVRRALWIKRAAGMVSDGTVGVSPD